jgi:TIR domain
MSIPTYFSHSYRVADQHLNQTFWSHFSEVEFSFFVDPPSDSTIHTHLERMMRRCSAFVGVVNRRRDVSRFFCSRFVLFEFGLSIQAKRPRLLLIDQRVNASPFERLSPDERHSFLPDKPEAGAKELIRKIRTLKRVAATFPNRLDEPRGPIAVLVPRDRSECAYADPHVLRRIEEAADASGFELKVLELPHEHNAFLALELEQQEAVILDVRGMDLPEWVFPYVYGRLIPTIKLVRLMPDEVLSSVKLPPIVGGLRMDTSEPGVESVTYWRDPDDLVCQLERAFRKLDEEQTMFQDGRRGVLYFESIGRRPARVFISNAAKANPLGRRLAEELRLRNMYGFQYKEPNAILPGSNWEQKIRNEVETCDIFLAIVGEGYKASKWCMEEMRAASARVPKIVLLPYQVDQADVGFMDKVHVAQLPSGLEESVQFMLDRIHSVLTDKRGQNAPVTRTTMLGGSREAIIDTIRHIPSSDWPTLMDRMRESDIAISAPDPVSGPVRSRDVAEKLFMDAQQVDTDPDNESNMATLVRLLARLAPPTHQELMRSVALRTAKVVDDDAD